MKTIQYKILGAKCKGDDGILRGRHRRTSTEINEKEAVAEGLGKGAVYAQ